MTSKHEEIVELIGGDDTLTRLKAKRIEACEGGLTFFVPILGGMVKVGIVSNESLWDLSLDIDPVGNMARSIEQIPGENLKVIIGHLFLL